MFKNNTNYIPNFFSAYSHAEFMRQVNADEPSSFEKLAQKLEANFFESDDHQGDSFPFHTSNSILTDRLAKDAKIQEVFQTVGGHQKKNWAKSTVLNRDFYTSELRQQQRNDQNQYGWNHETSTNYYDL